MPTLNWLAVPVPLVDVKAQYGRLIPQILERFEEVLDSGTLILGPNVKAFEEEAAAYLGVPEAVGVANGTDALVLVLEAMEIGPGDEVICPSFTFYATAEAIMRTGATPVFADIDAATLNVDPDDVAAKVTDRTKALMPVHLFGRPADLELAERVRLLRFHGSSDKKTFIHVGTNSRLDELQAAALRLFLGELDGWNRARRDAAARYAELGLGEFCDLPEDEPGHVYHMYVVRSPERSRYAEALSAAGIGNASYYVTPTHLQPALVSLGVEEGTLPETERASRENLALPMWAGITEEIQERVVSIVRDAASVRAAS